MARATSRPRLVAPENWQGALQPSAQAQIPSRNTPASGAGKTSAIYSGTATSPMDCLGTTQAAGVRHESAICSAAWASITLTTKVPNQATISGMPAAVQSNSAGWACASSRSPSMPGLMKNATVPMISIRANTKQLVSCVKAMACMPPAHRSNSSSNEVNPMDNCMDSPVSAYSAEANAMAVATDHMGKVNAVMVPPTPRARRPKRSPIRPEMVTTMRSLNDTTMSRAMSSTWVVSATPYQTAEMPV